MESGNLRLPPRPGWAVLACVLACTVTACKQADSAGRGSATLNWTPVTMRSDGAPLTDLAGYRIYYGTAPGTLNKTVVLADPKATTYVVTHLAPGTWYFAVAAYTQNGTESSRSNVGSQTIR
jgi:hypothetical protein